MPLPLATVELGISIAKGVIKLGGRIDVALAEEAANRRPVPMPFAISVLPPSMRFMKETLTNVAERDPALEESERNRIRQALEGQPSQADLIELMEDFAPDKLEFDFDDPNERTAAVVNALLEAGLADDREGALKLAFYLGPGADNREQKLEWKIGMAVVSALAEFALDNQDRFVREKVPREVLAAVLQRFATPELLDVASGQQLIRFAVRATLNGLVDTRGLVDGDNPWLGSLLDALADARAAVKAAALEEGQTAEEAEAAANNYLIGLFGGKGYKPLISELLEEGVTRLDADEGEHLRLVMADVLAAAKTQIDQRDHLKGFFQDNWPNLVRAGLSSFQEHGPDLLKIRDDKPLLSEILQAAVGSLAETQGQEFLSADALVGATEAAIAAVAAKPELLGDNEWLKITYGGFAFVVGDRGLRGAFSEKGLEAFARNTAERLAKSPELLVKKPGLPREVVGTILTKIAGAETFGLEDLALAAVDGALTAMADNPALVAETAGERYGPAVADLAGALAERVRDVKLNRADATAGP